MKVFKDQNLKAENPNSLIYLEDKAISDEKILNFITKVQQYLNNGYKLSGAILQHGFYPDIIITATLIKT